MDKINPKGIRSGGAHLTAPPYHDAEPVKMSRSVGKGKGGSNFSLSSRAKFGLNEGQDIVRMSRKAGSGPGGKSFSLSHEGPARSGRSPGGKYSHDSTSYGVGGVSGSGGTGFAVGGK
jgi:hypothetical protein